jgi:hypothetical protein
MNRRGFLQAILAAGVAPAVVGSGVLMPVRLVAPIQRAVEVVVDTELVVYGNTLLTVSAITREALRILEAEIMKPRPELDPGALARFNAAFDELTVRRPRRLEA